MSVRNLAIVSVAIVAVAVAVVANPAVAAETYNLDPAHTQPIFEVQHMGYSLQRGSFSGANGKITLDRDQSYVRPSFGNCAVLAQHGRCHPQP